MSFSSENGNIRGKMNTFVFKIANESRIVKFERFVQDGYEIHNDKNRLQIFGGAFSIACNGNIFLSSTANLKEHIYLNKFKDKSRFNLIGPDDREFLVREIEVYKIN